MVLLGHLKKCFCKKKNVSERGSKLNLISDDTQENTEYEQLLINLLIQNIIKV